jgi:hypothetical protein
MMVRYPQGRNLTDRQRLRKSATRLGTVSEVKMRSKVVAARGSVGRTVGRIDEMRTQRILSNNLRENVGSAVNLGVEAGPEAGGATARE